MNSNWLLLVALVIALAAQAECDNQMDINEAIRHERAGLDYDRRMFNDIRARYIVDQTRCRDRRSRRTAYKLVRELEQERAQAINKFLEADLSDNVLVKFYYDLRNIHSLTLGKLGDVEKLMAKACSYPAEAKRYASEAERKLRRFLEGRSPNRNIMLNPRKLEYPDEDPLRDAWDESEVDLASDREGAKAIAAAIKSEQEALNDDEQQLKKMGRSRDCKRVDETVFALWAKTRRQEIEKLLAGSFSSAKELRRQLAKTHSKHLALLENFDDELGKHCKKNSSRDMIHWMDTNFFERQLAVIRGDVWMRNKANGFKDRTIDFIDMKLFEMNL